METIPTKEKNVHRAKVVMLDQSFVDALFELRHRGSKMQAYTINQYYSLKGSFSAHFPIGHVPSADQCYYVTIKKDIRINLKSGASMHTGTNKQNLIEEALRTRDEKFSKYITEDMREAYLSLISSEKVPTEIELYNKATEFYLSRPVHEVIRDLVFHGAMQPYSSEKDVLRFIPIECETLPTQRVWYFGEQGRACFNRSGATQATPEIPEDVISIHFRSVSVTGSHWTDHWICIGEPVPIPIVIDIESNTGNKSIEAKTFLHTKGYQPTNTEEETRVYQGVTEHKHTGYEFWHPISRVHKNRAEQSA